MLSSVETVHDDLRIEAVLQKAGFTAVHKLTGTLQGSVWKVNQSDRKSKIVKVASRYYHDHRMARKEGKTYHGIYENVITERDIMRYLMKHENFPQSIVKYDSFLKSHHNYYLVMEYGGQNLFDFIVKAHKLIQEGRIEISEWRKVVLVMFKQMIECIEFIHAANVCHFDVSLENFVINEVKVFQTFAASATPHDDNPKCSQSRPLPIVHFVLDELQLKLIDFGLAEYFDTTKNECFQSNKYCGKLHYMSPEIHGKKESFNAQKNDIFCLGVCLFMMCIGNAPWNKAHPKDDLFRCLVNGQMRKVLKMWKKLHYVTEEGVDLMESIFQYEPHRISIQKIKQHPWMQSVH